MRTDRNGKGLNTIIGKGSAIEGNLHIINSIRIEGIVKGNITCTDAISLGSEGMAQGEIQARSIIVSGKIVGNVDAKDRAELETSANVHGDITTKQVIIHEGAFFQGNCIMKKDTPLKNETTD